MAASDGLDPEELLGRMTDEELLGLTPQSSRPGSAATEQKGLGQLLEGKRTSSAGSRRPSVDPRRGDATKASLMRSESAPVVGALRPTTAAEVKAQRKEAFHFKRQRRWLEIRNKHECLSFTEKETTDFHRFFHSLTEGKDTMRLDQFEDMLVCLDLAKTKRHVRNFIEGVGHPIIDDQINFEDFLKAFESQLDSSTMEIVKLLLQGSYDDRDLDYPTFISERRRELIINATGAKGKAPKGTSAQIVRTFSDLLEDRCYQEFSKDAEKRDDTNGDGVLLMGGLGTMWQVACVQHGLARTLTAEERTANFKKSIPLSPRTVVKNIVKIHSKKDFGVHRMGNTVIIEADRLSA